MDYLVREDRPKLLTCVWVHGEVRVPLTDAVDQLGAVPVHAVISVCGRDLDDGGAWKTEGRDLGTVITL